MAYRGKNKYKKGGRAPKCVVIVKKYYGKRGGRR